MSIHQISPSPPSRGLNIGLWAAQTLIFVSFAVFGFMKMFMPVDTLAAMWVWPGQLPTWFLRLMGLVDAAGGAGVFLPAVTRIKPGLTVLAALGCVVLQISAIVFHISRGEAMVTPLNFVLLALSAFILWGRGKKAPIFPRA
ncbi:DoxX family protein [Rhizobium freirei]|uniref:DoxX family protein n=1 Tax=Rhizobium freirei TaxID=1353277 RepID=UPI0003A81E6B|nr:DoxX family protein [Rhizobium freirei]